MFQCCRDIELYSAMSMADFFVDQKKRAVVVKNIAGEVLVGEPGGE